MPAHVALQRESVKARRFAKSMELIGKCRKNRERIVIPRVYAARERSIWKPNDNEQKRAN
jgi:hypothetical protein